ncbi:hypothetical protein HQ533_03765 [Candidatus Woesearchaeota archaeon]|nr:hypothetical protein [Candidatus Woesearchaeota archaeon]
MKNKRNILGILLIAIIVLVITGCAEKECKAAEDCANKTCFDAACADNACAYSMIADCCGNEKCEQVESYESCADDCPNCDDKNSCTIDEYDYHDQTCENTPITDVVCCGNAVCEAGEAYENCPRDCPDCGVDNACKTNTRYDYHIQECVSDVLIPCCGNDICDEGDETFSSCDTDCPNCDDYNQLTTDSFNFETQGCENPVTHLFLDDFESGTGNWQLHSDNGWTTKMDEGNTVFWGRAGQRADLKNIELTNYILKLRIKAIEDLIGIRIKELVGTSQGGRYTIYLSSHAISLERSPKLPETLTAAFEFGDGWHDLEARIYEDTVNILADGEMLIKFKKSADDVPFPVGINGIFSMSVSDDRDDAEFLIDDFEIKTIEEGDVIYP